MIYELLELEQRTPEWYEFRQNHIGSSDAAIIMGHSPFKKEYDLWLEKLGLDKKVYIHKAMKKGIELESVALASFCDEIGVKMIPKIAVSLENPFMSASLDGLSKCGRIFVEIKCPGEEGHHMALNGNIPRYYYDQMQHQMAVMGHQMCYYYSFDGKEGIKIEVTRNNHYIQEIIKKESEFWYNVENFIAPESTIQTMETDEWKNLTTSYLNCKQASEKYAKEMDEIKRQLVSLCNGRITKGNGVKLNKIIKQGSVNYSNVPELRGIDLDVYRNPPTEYWKVDCINS